MSFPWANQYNPQHPVMQWVDSRLPLPRLIYNAVGAGYPVPRNINYWYNFGVLAGVALMVQIITGVVLAMHYSAHTTTAFNSVEHIMRNVNGGYRRFPQRKCRRLTVGKPPQAAPVTCP